MREIVSIARLDRRMPEHGRIRLGEKGAKGQPVKIDKFRFTSHDHKAITEIAALYGGTPKPWEQGQYEVKTEANVISVVLPPDPLGGTPIYELWSKGGVQRRCDGETCMVPRNGPEGAEMVEEPCICVAKDSLDCKPTTRLSVVLPDISFGGTWRLESGGWNVAHELPGMVEAIGAFATRGFTKAELALEERKSVFAGQTRKFIVPVIRPTTSVQQLIEGGGGLRSIASVSPDADQLALVKASVDEAMAPLEEAVRKEMAGEVDTSWEDGEIVDAEIVEDPPTMGMDPQRPFDEPMREAVNEVAIQTKRKRMQAALREIGMGAVERHALVLRVTKGQCQSSNDLTEEGLDKVIDAVAAIRAGKAEYAGEDDQGWAIVRSV